MNSHGWSVFTATLTLFLCCLDRGQCLQCPKCENMEVSGSSTIQTLFGGKTNPYCTDTLNPGTVPNEQCPYDGSNYKCGYTSGTATGSILFSSFKVKIYSRQCVVAPYGSGNGCLDKTEAVSVVNKMLSFLTELYSVQVDADVCYCDVDGCDAGTCSSGLKIGGICMVWYMWLGGVVGLILFFTLITGCCCCCCCAPCRKSASPQATTVTMGLPQTTVVQYPPPRQTNNYNTGYDQPSDVI